MMGFSKRTWYFLQRLLGHVEVTPEINRCLLHRTQAEKIAVARVETVLVGQEAVCVDFGIDGDVALDGADTSDVEAKFAIVGREQDVEQVGAETAVRLALGERLRQQLALGGGEGGERKERGY